MKTKWKSKKKHQLVGRGKRKSRKNLFRKTIKRKEKAYMRRNKKIKEKVVVRTETLQSKGKSKKRQQLGGSWKKGMLYIKM